MTTIRKRWIQSYPGCHQIFPLDLDPASIDAGDIFWALGHKCRFTGHVKHFYSVAQHVCQGALLLPPAFRLPFLLHEVSEAYLPDVSAPVKPTLRVEVVTEEPCTVDHNHAPDHHMHGFGPHTFGGWVGWQCVNKVVQTYEFLRWETLEAQQADVILPAIGLGSMRSLIDSPEVKRMDLAMLAAEKEQLLGPEPAPWGLTVPAADVKIYRMDPEEAAKWALGLFNELTGQSVEFKRTP